MWHTGQIIHQTASTTTTIIQAADRDTGEQQGATAQRQDCSRQGDLRVLPVLLLHIHKSPDTKQSHLYAPAPHFGLWDEGLLVCHPQLRCYVESCCCCSWSHHFGAHRSEHQEVGTCIYRYLTFQVIGFNNH